MPRQESVTVIREVSLLVVDAERPWEFHMCPGRGRSHHHSGVNPTKNRANGIHWLTPERKRERKKHHGCGLKWVLCHQRTEGGRPEQSRVEERSINSHMSRRWNALDQQIMVRWVSWEIWLSLLNLLESFPLTFNFPWNKIEIWVTLLVYHQILHNTSLKAIWSLDKSSQLYCGIMKHKALSEAGEL